MWITGSYFGPCGLCGLRIQWIMDIVDYIYIIQWITGYNSVAPQNALAFVPCYLIPTYSKFMFFLQIPMLVFGNIDKHQYINSKIIQ